MHSPCRGEDSWYLFILHNVKPCFVLLRAYLFVWLFSQEDQTDKTDHSSSSSRSFLSDGNNLEEQQGDRVAV